MHSHSKPFQLTREGIGGSLRHLIVGADELVPVVGGRMRPYINLDNAASTPTLKPIMEKVNEFLKWYSNVHRGTGFKSKLSSWAFEESRDRVAHFVNANTSRSIVLFSRNTTESINHLARRFPFRDDGIVMTTVMEHHSNELPWRNVARVVHVLVTRDGRIDEEDFRKKLQEYKGRIQLVAVTGASNVTGFINPIHTYARWVHAAGAKIFVDAAQLAPHRPIDMNPGHPDERLDYLAFSAHKMYAPFGLGVLIGERKTFEEGDPALVGGGTVDIVSLENAYWTDLPEKEEAGTPDIVGAVALGAAIECFRQIGWETIIEHEAELTAYALEKLLRIPKVTIYGDPNPARSRERLGVISFTIDGMPHALVASILSHEWAIGTRNGCFCAHPYVQSLMGMDQQSLSRLQERILRRDRTDIPGTVRASFGIYNTNEEIDILCEAVEALTKGEYQEGYKLNKERGEYYRDDFTEDFGHFLKF